MEASAQPAPLARQVEQQLKRMTTGGHAEVGPAPKHFADITGRHAAPSLDRRPVRTRPWALKFRIEEYEEPGGDLQQMHAAEGSEARAQSLYRAMQTYECKRDDALEFSTIGSLDYLSPALKTKADETVASAKDFFRSRTDQAFRDVQNKVAAAIKAQEDGTIAWYQGITDFDEFLKAAEENIMVEACVALKSLIEEPEQATRSSCK